MLFVTKKVINKKSYYYLQYGGRSLCLGDGVPHNIKDLLIGFFTKIGDDAIAKLNSAAVKTFAPKKLNEIEKMKCLFTLISSSELFTKEYADYLRQFIMQFAFNSNRSEGSKTKRNEFEKIAISNIRKPKNRTEREVLNSLAAIKFAFSDEMKWNLKSIRKIHSLLLHDLDDPLIVGKWKTENNVAPGEQPTAAPSQVKNEMKKLLEWFVENKKKIYPPLLAIEFYIRFESIHPFLDGNGRVGRILFNTILFHFNYAPIVFFSQNHKAHCSAITKATHGRSRNFRHQFLDQAKKTFNLIKII
ncbi:MAG: Fic family protein [Candidatus Peregrinibacteria bacterium]|nr:Fic family protein [Candidatus Peregrinibacteria bacterium]